jgi:hypothetical protein
MDSVKIIKNFINDSDIKIYTDYIDKYKDTESFRKNAGKLNGLGVAYRAAIPEEKSVLEHTEILPITKKYSELFIEECNKKFNDDRKLYFYGTSITRLSEEIQLRIHQDIHDEGDHISYSGVIYLNRDYTGGDILFFNDFPPQSRDDFTVYSEDMKDAFIYNQQAGDLVMFHPHVWHGSTKVSGGWRDAIVLWCTSDKDYECKLD